MRRVKWATTGEEREIDRRNSEQRAGETRKRGGKERGHTYLTVIGWKKVKRVCWRGRTRMEWGGPQGAGGEQGRLWMVEREGGSERERAERREREKGDGKRSS